MIRWIVNWPFNRNKFQISTIHSQIHSNKKDLEQMIFQSKTFNVAEFAYKIYFFVLVNSLYSVLCQRF